MDLGLEGRRALVLGGTRGLGRACALSLAGEGVRVIVNGRNLEHGQALAAALPDGAFIAADISVEADRAALVEAVERIGFPDIVVTNAGGPPAGPFEESNLSMWRKAFEANIAGPLEIVRSMLPAMRAGGHGRVINITSFVVRELYPNMSLSNGVRIGLTGAMGSLAREVALAGITVNGILRGLMDTGALQRVIQDRMKRCSSSEQAVRQDMARSIPAGRLGRAEDFGPLCAFLASPHAGYITGQNICVDGGLTKGVV